ncbi:ATP-dependent nuclease [Alkalihalobacillus pseudalcaliphilus]|uniref:ATP-dependent nuclease n=1 Tax=Alkalihalobacillus pseudalcaliphilus TaxID=79884 RepID=UPI00064E1240|nr:AAA family ATPase [Alkalihalobacillus pseudalcaliphilus]KMK76287.1 hypothetical protein AB990_13850 [Alkalihalobacillus pseudalcaliphilus]
MIEQIRLKNFKKFREERISLNKGRNILVGENGVGKSSILLAISCVLSGSYSLIERLGVHTLFNMEAINEFMVSNKEFKDLPIVDVELFISEDIINHDLNGKKNSTKEKKNGLRMRISPDEELSEYIADALKDTSIFPFEYYKVEFNTFSDRTYSSYKRYPNYIKYSYLDSSKVNSNNAMQDYINRIYESKTDRTLRNRINNKYRDTTQKFSDSLYSEFALESPNDLKIKLNNQSGNSFQNNITVEKSGIQIQNLGQGERIFINTEFLLTNSSDDSRVVLIEEPENHLSFLNMHKLIDKIMEAGDQKQSFIATHSNMIASRLDLQNAIFFSEHGITRLEQLNSDTANFFEKAPDNNVLNFILSKRAVLVEGDAEYILMNEFYKYVQSNEPYAEDISIVACGGKTFKRYLEIAKILDKKVAVITDNDHDYEKNITEYYSSFVTEKIRIFADKEDLRHTFEVSLYEYNKTFIDDNLKSHNMSKGVQHYMLSNKAEAAFRLLCVFTDNNENTSLDYFEIPTYIKDAIVWIRN